MVIGADTPDQPGEAKKPDNAPLDFISQMLAADPAMMDKARLAQQVEGSLDQTLKLLQIMYYMQQLGQTKMLDKLIRNYSAAIELMAESVNKSVVDFQKKYGEI